jgi:AAA15 family ATPase/GTPase
VRGDDAFGHKIASKGVIDPRAVAFLKCADTGIVDAKLEELELTGKSKQFADSLRKVFQDNLGDSEISMEFETSSRSLTLGHSTSSGETVYLPFFDESRGTARLFDLIVDVYEVLDDGGVFVVDELDNSLHTVLASELVRLFGSPVHNKSGAQLIFTTHDTNLMRHDLFRRDQIWLCEKDRSGATCIYPLTDISVRRTDNIEKGYLQGRFGAVPFWGGDGELLTNDATDAS